MVCARHAVVVTHSRLRESGTVVSEAVDRLRNVGFEVSTTSRRRSSAA